MPVDTSASPCRASYRAEHRIFVQCFHYLDYPDQRATSVQGQSITHHWVTVTCPFGDDQAAGAVLRAQHPITQCFHYFGPCSRLASLSVALVT